MNLRDIKKDIEYFIGEFIDDCSLFVMLNPGKDNEKVSGIINEAVDLYNDLKDKINNAPKPEKKDFYIVKVKQYVTNQNGEVVTEGVATVMPPK